ncbi:MAG: YkgJ family cysteine cluster protein [Planctomycetota bacterium]|jgi:hypothetical protein
MSRLKKSKGLNGGWTVDKAGLIKKVADIYQWLDSRISRYTDTADDCRACGRCCDFEKFDHRLFVTTAELIYLKEKLGGENIRLMPTGICPYNIEGKCDIYEHRFVGCRIFYCKADKNFQSSLSESALGRLKLLCTEFEIDYSYTDLPTALNSIAD